MRSLFVKIFIWFWLAMVLVSATLVVSVIITQSKTADERMRSFVGTVMPLQAQRAAEVFDREGQTGLVRHFREMEQVGRLHGRLFDAAGQNVLGNASDDGTRELVLLAGRTGRPEFQSGTTGRVVAQRAEGPSGREYVLVTERPRPPFPFPLPFLVPFGPRRPELGAQALHLLTVLLVAGVVCFWLARYITTPVVRLRAAARRLASGELSARVGPALGNRRDELADLARDFDFMAGRIESLVTSERRLLRDISHELRSPLARLNVALGLARQRAGASANGALDRIGCEADRLNTMIGQLLVLARLETGVERIEGVPVDLGRLVRETASDADFEARSLNRAIRLVKCADCKVIGTEALLRSAIENVLRNAARYTAEGTEAEVELSVLATGRASSAVIRVRDHGPGVPEPALNEIFRPFYRLGDDRGRQTGGTGLGLAITERAVRLHGGTVTAFNADDGGLVVELSLPIFASVGEASCSI
jgi:two-component system sensor histidine kinase CpxA